MKTRLLATIIVATILAITMVGLAHIRNLDNQIQFKKIELQDNSVRLKLLDNKYTELNKELDQSGTDKAKIQQQLQDLQKERDSLQQQLQSKLDAKQADIASKAVQTVTGTPAYAATGNCGELSSKLSALGISGAELSAAITLATRESSCRSAAVNASSGSCGEFQSLPCGKWGTPGTTQYLQGAIKYSQDVYGGFVNALAHSYSYNWY